MGINEEVYSKNKRAIEGAITNLVQRENALKYLGKTDYKNEVTIAKEKLIVLLGLLEGMNEKYPDKLFPTEIHISEEGVDVPKAAKLVVYRGKSICISHALNSKKEIFYINMLSLISIPR